MVAMLSSRLKKRIARSKYCDETVFRAQAA